MKRSPSAVCSPSGPRNDRHRHQRDRRHPGVDQRQEHGGRADHAAQIPRPPLQVGGQVGGRLDPGERERGHRQRLHEVPGGRRREQVDVRGQQIGVHGDDRPDRDHGELQGDVGERQDDQRALADVAGEAGDVDAGRERDHRGRDRDLRPAVREAAPDRAQVVGHRDRRQGDDDDVVDQDRPAGDEADQLVERVARERRRAAALEEHRAALDVAERGEHEQEPRGQEDQRRQPEAAVGDDADREVEREADRRVGDREQPRNAEDAPRQRALAEPQQGQPPAAGAPGPGPGPPSPAWGGGSLGGLSLNCLTAGPDRGGRHRGR